MSLSIRSAAADQPDHPALVAGGSVRTFASLADAADRAGAWLRERGVEPGQSAPVALVARNTEPTLVMLHALIDRAVPVHLIHPAMPTPERDALVRRSGAAVVITDDWSADDVADAAGGDPRPPRAGPPPADERTLAVVYTSGSTGRPKGVVLSRRAFVAAAEASAANLGWRPDDRWLLRLPIAHVGGLSIVTRCLLARATVVLPDPAADGLAAITGPVDRDRVTLVSLVPTLLRRLLDREPCWDPPPHLRVILLGGAAPPADLLRRAADRGWPVLTTYGMSECCSQVATQRPWTRPDPDAGVGAPLPGVEVRSRESEIQVRGPTLFSGYHPPAESPAPLTADGWFATGDRGHLDAAGHLHVTGRLDDLIISGGENVDPREVEDAIRRLPGVRDVCVVGLPDAEWGQRVGAAIVPEPDAATGPDPVAALRGRLAAFKIPRSVVLLPALPLNDNGKVDRHAVRAHLLRQP